MYVYIYITSCIYGLVEAVIVFDLEPTTRRPPANLVEAPWHMAHDRRSARVEVVLCFESTVGGLGQVMKKSTQLCFCLFLKG